MAWEAILWDLDGTLIDPGGGIRETLDHVLAERGLQPFDPETRRLIGMPLADILRLRTDDEAAIAAMVGRYREVFGEVGWRRARWVTGVRELLTRLHSPMAVVTTKGEAEAEAFLAQMGAQAMFATVVGDDDRRPLKPDPAPVLEACRRLGVDAEAAVMVGDTAYDVGAAKAAGSTAVGVLWGHGNEASLTDADHIVADVEALAAVLTRGPSR